MSESSSQLMPDSSAHQNRLDACTPGHATCRDKWPVQEQVKSATFDDRQHTENDFFDFVEESYSYFLSGDDVQCHAVDDRVAQEFGEQQEAARLHAQTLQQVKRPLHQP